MSEVNYTLTQVSENEAKEFSMYTIQNRAIPSSVDGLKPSQRFYLYSSLMNTKNEFRKVSAVAGVISDYGYNHGEVSAASTGQLMAAPWNNNVCLIQGRGNFGTRQKPNPAASRYTYTQVHQNFYNYIKDIEISPKHSDPEHLPPAFYVPVIPLVLANGAEGVAVAFSTSILPRSVESLVESCAAYLKTGTPSVPVVTFPEFRGSVTKEGDRFIARGYFERKSKTVIVIHEIPPEITHEKYITHLNELEDNGSIVGYDDDCDESGFKFTVTLKRDFVSTEENISKLFKLQKPFSENINVIDWNGKLRSYTSEVDLIRDFCDYRLEFLKGRIAYNLEEYTAKALLLRLKINLITDICDGKINLMGMKKAELVSYLCTTYKASQDTANEAASMSIYNMTADYLAKLRDDEKKAEKALNYWQSTNPKAEFLHDLKSLK